MRKLLLFIFLLWSGVSLACNFPVARRAGEPTQSYLIPSAVPTAAAESTLQPPPSDQTPSTPTASTAPSPIVTPALISGPPFPGAVLPDSEVVDSPAGLDFDLEGYVAGAGGYLSRYSQVIEGESLSGAQIVRRVAENTSVSPRLLLSMIEFRSGWVSGTPADLDLARPLGFQVADYNGLFLQLSLVGKLTNIGYYGWRQGTMNEIKFMDGPVATLDPNLNAGTVALQYLFARLYRQDEWQDKLYGPNGFLQLHESMFGDAWARAERLGPLLPPGLEAPVLELPFAPGEPWSLTAGPHPSWNTGTPPGALDFAPITGEPPCTVSRAWARAAAPGVVVRSSGSVVIIDLDGDGREQTGWVLLYQHIAVKDRVAAGTRVNTDDPIGHPSCEGGSATGTHVHLARKYNGEWISIGGQFPLVLSGWLAVPGERQYQGTLIKGDQVVTAYSSGRSGSKIVR